MKIYMVSLFHRVTINKANRAVGDFSPIGVNALGSLEGFDSVGQMPVKVNVLQKNLCQLSVDV